MTVQFQLFDTAALIDNLQLAFELSATTGETVELEETYTPAQVNAAIAALNALPKQPAAMTMTELRSLAKAKGYKGYSKLSKIQLVNWLQEAERFSALQVASAIAKLRLLPPKEGGRQEPNRQGAA